MSLTRRKFAGRTLLGLTALIIAPITSIAKESVSKTKTMAKKSAEKVKSKLKEIYAKADLAETKKNASIKALKYYADATKSPELKKKGAAAASQLCSNCMHYKAPGLLKGTKEEVGKCLMMQNQLVHGDGWCFVYVKKP